MKSATSTRDTTITITYFIAKLESNVGRSVAGKGIISLVLLIESVRPSDSFIEALHNGARAADQCSAGIDSDIRRAEVGQSRAVECDSRERDDPIRLRAFRDVDELDGTIISAVVQRAEREGAAETSLSERISEVKRVLTHARCSSQRWN